MDVSVITNDLESVSSKLTNIISDIETMVVIDDDLSTTKSVKDELTNIKSNLEKTSTSISESAKAIKTACNTLRLNVK